MCTLIALHQVHCELPLVIAANRDELYARRSSGPLLLAESPRIVGGRDEEKGGSWLGASARRFFVGLTNQRTFAPPDTGLRSRGEIVVGALGQADLAAAVEWLRALDGREFNSCNLLLGDARALWVAYARRDAERVEVSALPPGIWALPNDRLGSLAFPKIDRAIALATPLVSLPWPALVPRAQAMLADHELPAPDRLPDVPEPPWLPPEVQGRLQALCVHTPAYGTRSASLLALSADGVEHYLHADGPPCQAPLLARDDLVAALRR